MYYLFSFILYFMSSLGLSYIGLAWFLFFYSIFLPFLLIVVFLLPILPFLLFQNILSFHCILYISLFILFYFIVLSSSSPYVCFCTFSFPLFLPFSFYPHPFFFFILFIVSNSYCNSYTLFSSYSCSSSSSVLS